MKGNAPFNNARGTASSLQLAPPFAFKDVTMSVFPLRASLPRLERFCDALLNQAGEAIRFEPFLPYVYLIILDYGRMSVEAANMGWISQREIAFSVPLRWMQKKDEDGILEFRDWAFTSPFIFVDNVLSMSTGREVFGWPKTLVQLDPTISTWVEDPPASRRVFHVSTKAVRQAFAGERFERQPFLNVYHRAATNILNYPPDLQGLFRPLAGLPNAGLNGARLAADLTKTFCGIVGQGITGTSAFPDLLDADRLKTLLTRETLEALVNPSSWRPGLADLLWSLVPKLCANTINLKQFRDAASPVAACYQAITNAEMKLECLVGGGPLGQQNLLLGQIDGGYSIEMHRLGNLPIIDALGLEVAEARRDGDADIATLEPVFPFWMKVDMTYGLGDVVTWRSSSTAWQWQVSSQGVKDRADRIDFQVKGRDLPDDVDKIVDVSPAEKGRTEVRAVLDFKPTTTPIDNLFNTARGAGQELSAPFLSPDTTIRVLPLLANEAALNRFVASYLDIEGQARFRAWGRHVYLMVLSYPGRSSQSQNVGLIANREINFAVPVKCYEWFDDNDPDYDLQTSEGRRRLDRDKLTGAALVVPFSYVDDVTVAITSSEVEGVPTLRSSITSPPVRWMDGDGPDGTAGATLMETSALVLPSLGVGAGAREKSFLSIGTTPLLAERDEAGWRRIARSWGPHLRDDLARKFRQRGKRSEFKSATADGKEAFRQVRALALEVMTGKLPIVSLALKQFRDSWNTESACYQCLVQGERRIDALHELQEIEEALHVSITRFPTQPIADVLGLIPKHTEVGRDGIVDRFEAIRPFWLRADLRKELGKNLFERVAKPGEGDDEGLWVPQEHPHRLFGWHPTTPDELVAIRKDPQVRKQAESEPERDFRIMGEHGSGNRWKRREDTFRATDVDKLGQRQADGTRYRNMMVWRRRRTLPVMATPERLNALDREHVPDLGAYLASLSGEASEALAIADLAESLGAVDPATVLDSILSRQWGCPEDKRRDFGKSDFCVHAASLGPLFEERLFPREEQQDRFWPQDADFKAEHDDAEAGLVLQIQRAVWKAVDEARPVAGKGKPKDYAKTARDTLPAWFRLDEPGGGDPLAWAEAEWDELAAAMQRLIEASTGVVERDPTIRRLTALRTMAIRQSRRGRVDAMIDPDDVLSTLDGRLKGLAAPLED